MHQKAPGVQRGSFLLLPSEAIKPRSPSCSRCHQLFYQMEFTLKVIPPTGTHQSAIRILKNRKTGKKFVGKMKSSEGKRIQQMFWSMLAEFAPKEPLEGPLQLQICYVYSWRKSETKKNKATGWLWKTTKPDCTNFPKTLEDCMTDLGFWKDDNQVCQLLVEKAWGDHWGIRVKIVKLNPTQPPRWYKTEGAMT